MTFTLTGTVTDTQGRPIAEAKVELLDGQTLVCGANSGKDGHFIVVLDEVDGEHDWKVEVTKDGYKRFRHEEIPPEGTKNLAVALEAAGPVVIDQPKRETPRKRDPSGPPWTKIAATALVVAAVVILLLWISGAFGGKSVPLPDLVGFTPAQAHEKFASTGLVFEQAGNERTGTHPAGTIVRTEPSAGPVPAKSTVRYYLEEPVSFVGLWYNSDWESDRISLGIRALDIKMDAAQRYRITIGYFAVRGKQTPIRTDGLMPNTAGPLRLKWTDPQNRVHDTTLTMAEPQLKWEDAPVGSHTETHFFTKAAPPRNP